MKKGNELGVKLKGVEISESYLECINNILRQTDCGPAGILAGIPATDAQIEEYANAVIICADALYNQAPAVMLTPERGGAIFGRHVKDVEFTLELATGKRKYINKLNLAASGISKDQDVAEIVESQIRGYQKGAERLYDAYKALGYGDETLRKSGYVKKFESVTLVDTAYVGMAYPKILEIVKRTFPESRINGILAQDKSFAEDLRYLGERHKELGGEFFYVRAPLIFEDQPTMYHRLSGTNSYFAAATLGFQNAERKVLSNAMEKLKERFPTASPAIFAT